MHHIYTLIDTHPAIAWITVFAATGILLYVLKLYDKDRSEPKQDRYYSPKK